jgi:hypothetical protein
MVWYATREAVKAALDSAETARNNGQIDRAIEGASRSVEALTHRRFYPQIATRYFDWPDLQRSAPWRLWLDGNELASATSVTAGGVILAPGDYILRRSDNVDEPPYTHIEINLAGQAAFGGGPTQQRSIAVAGVYAGCVLAEAPGGLLAEALDATETAVDVTDSVALGVGTILRVNTERMICTGKSMVDTGQNLQAPVGASPAEVTVPVTNGATFTVGEMLLLDAERMLVVDIAGNNLVVKRAFDGSVLATHTGSDIYAPRTLTVTRGALGTTAAAHDTAAPIAVHLPPGPVVQLTIAEALNTLGQETSGYARTVGSGSRDSSSSTARPAGGAGLPGLRDDVHASHGRQARNRAV